MSHYVYILFREDDVTPFYVGMSHRDSRIAEHEYFAATSKKNSLKRNVSRKVLTAVGHIPFVYAAKSLSLEEARRLETVLIKHFGRFPNGPLVNSTDGGEGIIGYVLTEEDRAKLSASLKKRVITPEHCAAISRGKMGHVQPESARRKMSVSKKALGVTPAMKAANDAKIGIKRPEAGVKIGDALRGVPKSPEHIAAARAALLASPKWKAHLEKRRRSRKGDSAPPPVEV